jgi:membrane fusion protein, heavy metal efflux system
MKQTMKRMKRKMKGKSVLVELIFLAVVIVGLSCNRTEVKETENQTQINDTFFKFIGYDTAMTEQVRTDIHLTGNITFDQDKVVKISPFAGGIIESLKVSLGDFVKKGQVLAVIRSTETADYHNQLVIAQSNLAISKKNAEMAEDLYKNGLTSDKDRLTAQKELAKSEEEVNRINQIMSLYGNGKSGRYTINSPISGYIVEKNATENMQFRTDNQDNLFTISNLNNVWVMGNVYESDIPKIKLGYKAEVTTISYPDKIYEGKIDKISNVIDPDTKVMKVRLELANPDLMLKPDMFANIRVYYFEPCRMICISSKSIVFDKNKQMVLVFHDKKHIESREVQVYSVSGNKTYISSGLKEGEVVVSKNTLILYNALNS